MVKFLSRTAAAALVLGAALPYAGAQRRSAAQHPPQPKTVALAALTPRERVVQLLDRFTYGPRPGDVDRVLAMRADAWLEQQLAPDAIKDQALDRRLAEYPTLSMMPQQAITVFPDRAQVSAVAEGRVPYPVDPLRNAVFEVQVTKWNREKDAKRPDGSGQVRPELTEAEKAAAKKQEQDDAAHIAGELFAMPKALRMNALIAMPVDNRIAFTGNGNLPPDQKNLLMGEFTPREREAFQAMAGQVSSSGNLANELAQGRILRDILTERQLQAVMTDFWFNHFNVFIGKDSDQWYTTSYERDAIRRNALGNFRDLLLATAQSPAMMVYLDNWLSIGPDSQANGVDPRNPKSKKGNKGLNENYGREVMELHTVGVNGGYTQADVTALSAILTGWGVDQPAQGGPFLFDQRRHQPGDKQWFGHTIREGHNPDGSLNGKAEGMEALNILAASPQTAHFIATLLAQYFVADEAPSSLVDSLTQTYLSSHGDIKAILRTLIASPEFNSRKYFHTKVKTPVEFIASAFRATATDPVNPGALVNTVKQMGMPLYYALPPTGYYLTADQWMNSVALVDRLNFAYQLTTGKFSNQKFDSPKLLALGLMSPGGLAEAERPLPSATAPGHPAKAARPKLVGMSSPAIVEKVPDLPVAPNLGAQTAMHVLESTMIGAPVSAKTNELIGKQLADQPSTANPTDTLNLLTALVMGAPEFQLR